MLTAEEKERTIKSVKLENDFEQEKSHSILYEWIQSIQIIHAYTPNEFKLFAQWHSGKMFDYHKISIVSTVWAVFFFSIFLAFFIRSRNQCRLSFVGLHEHVSLSLFVFPSSFRSARADRSTKRKNSRLKHIDSVVIVIFGPFVNTNKKKEAETKPLDWLWNNRIIVERIWCIEIDGRSVIPKMVKYQRKL